MTAARGPAALVRQVLAPVDLPGRRAVAPLLLASLVAVLVRASPVGAAHALVTGAAVSALLLVTAAAPVVTGVLTSPARRGVLRCLLVGLLVWVAAHVVLVRDVVDGGVSYPSPAQWLFVASVLVLGTAVVLDDERASVAPVAVEALVVVGGGATTTAALLAGPVLAGWVAPTSAVTLLAPGTWLALAALVVARCRAAGRPAEGRDVQLVTGLALLATAEATMLVVSSGPELGRFGLLPRLLAYGAGLLLVVGALARPPRRAAVGTRRLAVGAVVGVSATTVLLVALHEVLPAPFGRFALLAAVVTCVAVHVLLATSLRAAGGARAAREAARTDELTGAANRRALRAEVEERPARGALGLVVVDLDGFKQVNDRHGHAAGDAVLVATADRLRSAAGPDAVVARLGGDEFAVLVRGADAGAEAVAALARRCAAGLAHPVDHAGLRLPASGSVGTARRLLRGDGPGEAAVALDDLLREADRAMYAVKASRPSRAGRVPQQVSVVAPAP